MTLKVQKKYMVPKKLLQKSLDENLKLTKKIYQNKFFLKQFENLCKIGLETIKNNKKIIFFGNGGSAADSQHLATELTVRFKKNRKAIPAIALTTDTSALTAIGNDLSFNKIFSRQLEALLNEGDLIIPISTSGNSQNIIDAIKFSLKKKVIIFPFLGKGGGKIGKMLKNKILIPSNATSRVQEFHIFAGQTFCEFLENELTKKKLI